VTRREQAALGAALGLMSGLLCRDLDLTSLVSFWGDRGFLLPLGAIIGAICATTRLRTPLYVVSAGLALTWLAVTYGPVSRLLATGLVRSDALRPADAVLVLSSRMQTDGDPTSVQLARLYRGLELVKDGHAPRLMISELPPPYAQQAPFAKDHARALRARGGAGGAEPGPQHPRRSGVGRGLPQGAKPQEDHRDVLAHPHLPRRRRARSSQGLDVMASPARETRFDLETLDQPEERLASFGSIIHERVGIVVYRRRGWMR
jgi:hypothetical protein